MPKDDVQRGQNIPAGILVTLFYTAVLLSFITSKEKPFENLIQFIDTLSAKDGIFLFFSPILSVAVISVFRRNLKEMLVFWRFENILPGHRAFTSMLTIMEPEVPKDELLIKMLKHKIIHGDSRELPTIASEQNAAWYKIYSIYKNAKVNEIIGLSKNYVLLRDSAAVGFIFFIFGTLGMTLTNTNVDWIPVYGIVTLILYAVLAIGAKNQAENLVHDVLYKFCNQIQLPKVTNPANP